MEDEDPTVCKRPSQWLPFIPRFAGLPLVFFVPGFSNNDH